MIVIFTDLDGTLLDRRTYSWEAARPALDQVKRSGIACVLVTSKTRAEVEFWRGMLGNNHPFSVENGAAAYFPAGYFPFPVPGAASRDGFEVLEWGTPYATLVAALDASSRTAHCRVLGFHQMIAPEISMACDLPLSQAVLAQRREYDEPFRVLEPERAASLWSEIEARGLQWSEGGRFHHIYGNHDKALAVRTMIHLFAQLHEQVITIGLGDALNDVAFLDLVDIPVVVRSESAAELVHRLPRAILTKNSGARGWSDAILELVATHRTPGTA